MSDDTERERRSDPFGDMRRTIDRLESRIDMGDQITKNEIARLRDDVQEIEDRFDLYVTIARYSPVEKLVYGLVGLILTMAVVALMSVVFTSPTVGP